ncbi:MAG TPA: hypothetical protein VMU47_08410, partial [Caldimonas sp.]|nr:hypothetical protein [Caldimonas sp.]
MNPFLFPGPPRDAIGLDTPVTGRTPAARSLLVYHGQSARLHPEHPAPPGRQRASSCGGSSSKP